MKILLTGGSGLLGQYLNIKLSAEHELLTLYNENPGNCHKFDSIKVDITDKGRLSLLFGNFRPDAVVHTACYSRPEICASLPRSEVYKLNVDATENIARLCSDFGSKMIFTSTDLVYADSEGGMADENDALNPLTLYAESKLMGEIAVQRNSDYYLILRTALLIGFGLNHSRNNFHNTYETLKAGKEVRMFHDQYRTPLSIRLAADMISRLCGMSVKNEVINFGGRDRVSRLQIGEMICEYGGFDRKLLIPDSCKSFGGLTQVPDVSMNTDKLKGYGLAQESIHDEVAVILKNVI